MRGRFKTKVNDFTIQNRLYMNLYPELCISSSLHILCNSFLLTSSWTICLLKWYHLKCEVQKYYSSELYCLHPELGIVSSTGILVASFSQKYRKHFSVMQFSTPANYSLNKNSVNQNWSWLSLLNPIVVGTEYQHIVASDCEGHERDTSRSAIRVECACATVAMAQASAVEQTVSST